MPSKWTVVYPTFLFQITRIISPVTAHNPLASSVDNTTFIGCAVPQPFTRNLRHQNANDVTCADPVQNVCTNSSYGSGGRFVSATATDYFDLCYKIYKCTWIKYVSLHVINYQHISIAFAIIIRVALQEYEEYNNTMQQFRIC